MAQMSLAKRAILIAQTPTMVIHIPVMMPAITLILRNATKKLTTREIVGDQGRLAGIKRFLGWTLLTLNFPIARTKMIGANIQVVEMQARACTNRVKFRTRQPYV